MNQNIFGGFHSHNIDVTEHESFWIICYKGILRQHDWIF
ncbi:hypothetical protein DJ66_0192 [Candidatus Liberibacter solanacearum]|uniref:Uncharacterized protein n=1 Tax=Candidatus Liberibacter solanacearum TaxID=556287 RepID=A0A0F4VMF2_9HYPH|nr:hypothetical protein DJ66_0192 [Candidatus Liberibacter solanacearum]